MLATFGITPCRQEPRDSMADFGMDTWRKPVFWEPPGALAQALHTTKWYDDAIAEFGSAARLGQGSRNRM